MYKTNILHITVHMGDGAGKAIGGLAIMGSRSGKFTHRILLLDTPIKMNHIEKCKDNGIEIFKRDKTNDAIATADIVVLSWWGGTVMDSFLSEFTEIPCRVLLWSHKNGYYDPPFPEGFVETFDALLATSPFTLENQNWQKKLHALVYGFGDFRPENVPVKTDYHLNGDIFTIGYVGTPSYKKLPGNYLEYCKAVKQKIPNCHFVLAGEISDELRRDIDQHHMKPYFDLHGWVDDIYTLLKTFDVFGYLLRQDTFATTENAVIEAMASAVPVVVSKYPIGNYLLEDGISGFLADEPDEYGNIMYELYKDETLRGRIGKAGRMHTIQTYSTDENLKRFDTVCDLVMKKKKHIHTFVV